LALSNISNSGASANQVIVYNGTANAWATLTHSSISDFSSSVNSLISSSYPIAITNISNSGATNGQVLTYVSGTGNVWQNISGGTGTYQLTGAITGGPTNLNSTMTTSYASGSIVDVDVSSNAAIQISKINVNSTVNFNGNTLTNVNEVDTNVLTVTTISRSTGEIQVSNPLHFTDTGTSFSGTAFGYLNSSGTTGYNSSGGGLYSIKTNNRILCGSEIDCYSSKNIKKIISSCDDLKTQQDAIDLFGKIPFYKYNFIDPVRYGTGITYGIIAEYLEKIEPSYIKPDFEYIPNIYDECFCVKIDNEKYKIKFNSKINVSVITTKKIKIFFDNTEKTEYEILNIFDDHIIIKCYFDLPKHCFVYGTHEPCPSVTKTKVFELNCVVTKFLLRQNEELKNKNEELEKRIQIIETILSKI